MRLCVETNDLPTHSHPIYAAASVRLCVETTYMDGRTHSENAAASVRLCVETLLFFDSRLTIPQPPPCGCVLKLRSCLVKSQKPPQPPPCGCVLKPNLSGYFPRSSKQPPPCGCVLKHFLILGYFKNGGSRLRAAVC